MSELLDSFKENWGGLLLRLFAFLVLPLCLLAIPLATDENGGGQAASIFFILSPFLAWPVYWLLGKVFQLYYVDDWVSIQEIIIESLLFGAFLPLIILLPIYHTVDLTADGRGMLLACMVGLASIWLPILACILQTPSVLNESADKDQQEASRRSSENEHKSSSDQHQLLKYQALIDEEMKWSFLGYFGAFSVPLGILLTCYDYGPTLDVDGEATLMFFIMLLHCSFLLWNVAPRLGLVAASKFGVSPAARDTAMLWGKFVVCAVVAPLLCYLPALRSADLRSIPHDVLLSFIVAFPCITLFDIVRVRYYGTMPTFLIASLVLFFVVILPLGILLPIWIASDVGETGQILMLVFILTPLVGVLVVAIYNTARQSHNLPFQPLQSFESLPSWGEAVYAVILLVLPVCLLLPVFFHAKLDSSAAFVALGYMAVLCATIATLLFLSCCMRSPSDIHRNRGTLERKKKAKRPRGKPSQISEADLEKQHEPFMVAGPGSVGFDPTFGEGPIEPKPAFPEEEEEQAAGASMPNGTSNKAEHKALNGSHAEEEVTGFDRDDFEEEPAVQSTSVTGPVGGSGVEETKTSSSKDELGGMSRNLSSKSFLSHPPPPPPPPESDEEDDDDEDDDENGVQGSTGAPSARASGAEDVYMQGGAGDELRPNMNKLGTLGAASGLGSAVSLNDDEAVIASRVAQSPTNPTGSKLLGNHVPSSLHKSMASAAAAAKGADGEASESNQQHHTNGAEDYQVRELPAQAQKDEDGFERVTAWELDPAMHSLVCFSGDMELLIGAELARSDYYSAHFVTSQGDTRKYVLKWPLYNTMQSKNACVIALEKHQLAAQVIQAFNDALSKAMPSLKQQLELMEPFAVCLSSRRGAKKDAPWALCEPSVFLSMASSGPNTPSSLTQWNDCVGGVAHQRHADGDFELKNAIMQACSCFSFYHSKRRYLMCNLQGAGYRITNPDFHFADPGDDPFYSPNNHGEDGIRAFFASFQHSDVSRSVLKTLPDFDETWLVDDDYLNVE